MNPQRTKCAQTNRLDKDFEAMLFPLNMIQTITLQPKHSIINGFITRNGYANNLLCILGMLLMMILNMGEAIAESRSQSIFSSFVHKIFVFDAVFYITIILIMFTENFIHGNKNVELIIKMNQVHRFLGDYTVRKTCRQYNWIWFYFILSFYLFSLIYNVLFVYMSYFWLLSQFSLLYFDVNIICAASIIKFLTLEVNRLRQEIELFWVTSLDKNDGHVRKYLEEWGQILYNTYLNILEAYKLSEKIFHRMIVLFVVKILKHALTSVEIFIVLSKLNETEKAGFNQLSSAFIILLSTCKDFGLLCCLCAACQKFYLAISELNIVNIIKLQDEVSVEIRRLSKKMSKLNAAWNMKDGVHAGGVFRVDAAFPLQLLQLLAIYTIVLLQFAFL